MLGVIGGSGWGELAGFRLQAQSTLETPYGDLAAAVQLGYIDGVEVAFLPRHGQGHSLSPHQVNYRANIWALVQQGVTHLLAINAVGGIGSQMVPGALVVPDQLIDYSYGRAHSFNEPGKPVQHIEFAQPFAGELRSALCALTKPSLVLGATYGCTQGPRLETEAEVRRLQRDGCDLVGMTAMPEAALARELGLDYASLCIVVNWAAGLASAPISLEEIYQILAQTQPQVLALIPLLAAKLTKSTS